MDLQSSVSIFGLLQQQDPKENIFCKWVSRERILIFRLCLCCNLKWVSHIGTLLEADTVPFETHFGYGCTYGASIGDSLSNLLFSYYVVKIWITFPNYKVFYFFKVKASLVFSLRDPDADVYIHERTPTSMNTRTHTLLIWAPPKIWVGPVNIKIGKVRCLVVDGHVAYH